MFLPSPPKKKVLPTSYCMIAYHHCWIYIFWLNTKFFMSVISLQSTSLYFTPVWLRTKWNIFVECSQGNFLLFFKKLTFCLLPNCHSAVFAYLCFRSFTTKRRWNWRADSWACGWTPVLLSPAWTCGWGCPTATESGTKSFFRRQAPLSQRAWTNWRSACRSPEPSPWPWTPLSISGEPHRGCKTHINTWLWNQVNPPWGDPQTMTALVLTGLGGSVFQDIAIDSGCGPQPPTPLLQNCKLLRKDYRLLLQIVLYVALKRVPPYKINIFTNALPTYNQ